MPESCHTYECVHIDVYMYIHMYIHIPNYMEGTTYKEIVQEN